MAVYTPVSHDQVAALLSELGLGPLAHLGAIPPGIENTNYFVDTPEGRWVLTLFERLTAAELPFYLGLMHHLASAGLPVPDPLTAANGQRLLHLAGKPAAVVPCLRGASEPRPSASQCAAAGAMAARLQLAAQGYLPEQPNPRGSDWRAATGTQLASTLAGTQATLLAQELAHERVLITSAEYAELPQGAVHADLFRDNVLFDRGAVSGVIDFYFAGFDTWLYDLAVMLNDWTLTADGSTDLPRARALLAAYRDARAVGGQAMTPTEWRLLPAMRRVAALRFWLSRLADLHLPRPAQVLHPKDPGEYEALLRHCAQAHAGDWLATV